MIHLIILNGLGNQMFQYAFALALRGRGHKVKLDISYYDYYANNFDFKIHNGYELDRVFGLDEKPVNKMGLHIQWLRLLNITRPPFLFKFDSKRYDENYLAHPPKYLRGYWEDERYFKDIEEDVRKAFRFQGIDEKNQALAEEMRSRDSVSLHIRRGDFEATYRVLLGEVFYKKAVDYIKSKVENPFFYIFSDDAEVAGSIADSLGIEYKLLSHNRGMDSYKDMFLMSQCKHNIIANSTFSWWGAWLNDNKRKIVIAPDKSAEKDFGYHSQPSEWILI